MEVTASAAAEQVSNIDFEAFTNNEDAVEFVSIMAADTSDSYDVNTDVVQGLLNGQIEPSMLVDQAMMMAEDADQGWVADWLSAFSDGMNNAENDCDYFEHSADFTEDYYFK